MIRIIAVGSVKNKAIGDEIRALTKKLGNVEIFETKEFSKRPIKEILRLEASEIKKALRPSFVVCFDLKGKQTTDLSGLLADHEDVTFIIGGSHGLAAEITKKCDRRVSISGMTYPHMLFRAMVLDMIMQNHKL